MPLLICTGASCMCSFGTTPGTLNVTSQQKVLTGKPVATITDTLITPFGMCNSIANPQVASATAAALGVLTPMPCSLVAAGVWTPGTPKILVTNKPAVGQNSMLMCAYAGVIQITNAGQVKVMAT